MSANFPLVSIIITTYNRANTIERAIDSTLNQTYKNIEIIVVDDGSTDNTLEILNESKYSKIKLFKHDKNRGVTAAKNLGLDYITGEWFTFLDSDDEMMPDAIQTMMNIPLKFDSSITAVTCNCWDTTSKTFSGKGLNNDQYIDVNILMTVCKGGDFWGITKTSLLQNDRFYENLYGFESTLWYKVNDRAKRYYIHSALIIIHTDGTDRITKSRRKYNFSKGIRTYENIIAEDYYLNTLKKYQPTKYYKICRNGLITMKIIKNEPLAFKYYELLKSFKASIFIYTIYKIRFISLLINEYVKLKFFIRSYLAQL